MSFKKPSTLVREAKAGLYRTVGATVPVDPRRAYTDCMDFLSPSVLIGYKSGIAGYPTVGMKNAILEGALLAQRMVRKANDALASTIILRQAESPLFTNVMMTHFHLDNAGGLDGGYLVDNTVDRRFSLRAVTQRDRRWILGRIRENMLSLSFHLNTGVYLIDIDLGRRDLFGRTPIAGIPIPAAVEGWITPPRLPEDPLTWRPAGGHPVLEDGITSGFKNGEIHVSLNSLQHYSAASIARVIIHEASHKFLGTRDVDYAHAGAYAAMSLQNSLVNADSYAWAAVSLYCGAVKMGAPGSADWRNCTVP